MSRKIVSKFGGTSMADANAIKQSAKVASQNGSSIVVVSAVAGITDKLIYLAEFSGNIPERKRLEIINEIEQKHKKISKDLVVDSNVAEYIEKHIATLKALSKAASILGRSDAQLTDAIISHGELLSSRLICYVIEKYQEKEVKWLDARSIIKTDKSFGRALPDPETIKEKAVELLLPELENTVFITQGFIGKSPDGRTTTLGRGGSDYSAALFAEAVNADLIQIWTDVAGVASIDPRISNTARPITNLSFQEAAEMATSGAKILHPPTMIPARRASIPIFVGNTFRPEETGTTIISKPEKRPLVRAVTLKKDQRLVTLSTPMMSEEYGFLARIFKVFADHKISVDQVTTSEVSISITMDEKLLKNDDLFHDLKKIADISIEDNLCIVTLIGNKVNHTAGIIKGASNILQSEENKLNIRAIFQGASRHCVAFMVSNEEGQLATKKLHEEFIEKEDK